jgi:hypothetical protein
MEFFNCVSTKKRIRDSTQSILQNLLTARQRTHEQRTSQLLSDVFVSATEQEIAQTHESAHCGPLPARQKPPDRNFAQEISVSMTR